MIIKSKKIYEKAKKLIPGGVNSPVRSFKNVGLTPVFIKKAYGSKLIDEDDNEYIDYIGSWGSMILGHSNPIVGEEIKKAVSYGTSFGTATAIEVEFAEIICEAIDTVEMIRMVNSGTEAVMSAIRLARGYTGREKVLKFEGCYHGCVDGLLVKAGSGLLTTGIPNSDGIPKDYTKSTIIANYNDCENTELVIKKYKNELAAVIIEPVCGNMGLVLPDLEFLRLVRDLTYRYGILLIFDEVITGFRLHYGCAQQYFGINADITVLGKIIGGGMPIGVYGASKKIMKKISPLGPVYQAGTLSGNPVATVAGLATLKILRDNPSIYKDISEKANTLKKAYEFASEKYGVPLKINSIGSMLCPFFLNKNVVDYQSAKDSNIEHYAAYFKIMLKEGVYLPPSQFETMFVSYAHSYDDIEKTIDSINKALKGL